jgi:methylated-DNA-[protein]-cysteine S-methyltransferase
MEKTVFYSSMNSPIGELTLTSDGEALTGISMHKQKHAPRGAKGWKRDDDALKTARAQLKAYFEGELQDFDLPLAAEGTQFQRRVWQALRDIPYGVTISYGELARRIGQPQASRAVGLANGRNPIAIVVPCHRVIGADGTLTGYGGGLERKRWLLALESKGSLI